MTNSEDDTAQQRPSVLVADDATIGRALLSRILRNEYNVVEARNGVEVLRELQRSNNNISALILDLHMPVMDGWQVLEFMKENELTSCIPVIVLSVVSDTEAKMRCYRSGATLVEEKPFNESLLLAKIRALINCFGDNRGESVGAADVDAAYERDYYLAVLDSIPDAVFVIEPTSRTISYANSSFKYLLNGQDPTGKAISALFEPETAVILAKGANDIATNRIRKIYKLDGILPGRSHAVVYNILQDDNGNTTDIIGTILDLTASANRIKELEEIIRKLGGTL